MPGTYTSFYVVAFNLDDRDQAVQAFPPRLAADEATAIDAAGELKHRHAGVLVWRRDSDPAVGEEGDPVVTLRIGRVGDFD